MTPADIAKGLLSVIVLLAALLLCLLLAAVDRIQIRGERSATRMSAQRGADRRHALQPF